MFKGTILVEPGEVMTFEAALALGLIDAGEEVEAEAEENPFDKREEIR